MNAPVAPIRILIADDHPVVRVGVRAAIQQDAQLEVIAEVSTAEAAVESIERLNPEVAIIDLNMPQMKGIAAVQQIRKGNSHIKILILTAHDAEDLFQASMEGERLSPKRERVRGDYCGHSRRLGRRLLYTRIDDGPSSDSPAAHRTTIAQWSSHTGFKPGLAPDFTPNRPEEIVEGNCRGVWRRRAHRRESPRHHLRKAWVKRREFASEVRPGTEIRSLLTAVCQS